MTSRFAVSDDTSVYDQPTDDQRFEEARQEADWDAFVKELQVLYLEYLGSWPTVVSDLQQQMAVPECGGVFAAYAATNGWPRTLNALARAIADMPA